MIVVGVDPSPGAKAALRFALDATLREAIPDSGDVEIETSVVEGAPAIVLVRHPVAPICSSSDRVGTAASPTCCWDRSASSAPTRHGAPL